MKLRHILGALVALLAAAFGYHSYRTGASSAPGSPSAPALSANSGSGVDISFVETRSSSPQPIVTLVDERGSLQITNDPSQAADKSPLWTSTSTKSAQQNAYAHWVKHRAEFPEYRTADEYIAGAKAFFGSPPPGTLRKVRLNGDRLFFNPRDGTFGVQARNGAPRTMFRPDDGIRYWNRQ